MREIKFRAWLPKSELMTYDVSFDAPSGWANGKGVVYLQYTGLKDKNGKEIYEGDIVKVGYQCYSSEDDDGNEIDVYEDEWVQKIEYNPGSGYELCSPNGHDFFGEFSATTVGWALDSGEYEVEVIGNIYENPELLK